MCVNYRIYSRNSRTFFNQNFVSKFRVRDLCEETILRRLGVFVEQGKFNVILGVNALLLVHSPRILQTGLY